MKSRVLLATASCLLMAADAPVPTDPVSSTFAAQQPAFERPRERASMLPIRDLEKASVPFPETKIIVFPPAARWEMNRERRIVRPRPDEAKIRHDRPASR